MIQLRDNWIKKALVVILCLYLVVVLLLLFIGQQFWGFCYDHQVAFDNLVLFPFVAVLLVGLCWIAIRQERRHRDSIHRLPWAVLLGQLGFWFFQLLWVYLTRFEAITESAHCVTGAYAVATGTPVPNEMFFRTYPHNAPNALLTSYVIRLAMLLGMDHVVLFPYVGATLLNLTTLMIHSTVCRITGKRYLTWLSFAIGNLWIGLSQFMMIPYSDIYAVVFPVMAIWLLTRNLNRWWKWFLFTLVCFFGGAIRPTTLIIWIAFVLYQLVAQLSARLAIKEWLKRGAVILTALIVAIPPTLLWKDAAIIAMAGEKDPPEAFTMTHYLMLGMNYQTWGEFSNYDVNYSSSFATVEERQKANLESAWYRVSNLTPKEFTKFFLIKLYKGHCEGNFFADCAWNAGQPERNNPITPFLHSFYLNTGAYRAYYVSLQQVIWLAVLVLCLAAFLTHKRHHPMVYVVGIAMLGVTLYSLLAENWPRYLFMFAPIYLVAAMQGLGGIGQKMADKQ